MPFDLSGVPEWTELRQKRGLDPLGMQNSSVRIYQALVPGISNVTLRMRYYGLYAWLSKSYARTVADTNPKTWQRFVRRAEALYALVAGVRGEETGVAGALWANKTLTESQGRRIQFSEDADPGSVTHYLKQAWGAYGAAYASQLFEIGVFSSVETHEIPLPSAQLGEPLADVFSAAIGDAGDLFLALIDRGVVSHEQLEGLTAMSPSEIQRNGSERRFYERMLFAKGGLLRESDLDRRRTLLLLLHLASQLGRAPVPDDMRWCAYAGFTAKGVAWDLDNELQRHALRWRVYQANDLSHVAFEALLKYVLDCLERYPAGIPLESLIAEIVPALVEGMEKAPASWHEFGAGLELAANAMDEEDGASERSIAYALVSGFQRGAVYSAKSCLAAVRLLALVHKRMSPVRLETETELGGPVALGIRSLLTEWNFMESSAQIGFPDLLGRVFRERIVRRHLWVAMRKLRYQRDYTFLIDSDEGNAKLRDKDGPVWTTPRLGPAIRFLHDIHLINANGLTKRGLEVLEDRA